jgi:hypothetical protein
MLNARQYIAQFLGIFLLLCGYFLSDQPDSLSVMHFDPARPAVITKTVSTSDDVFTCQTSLSSQSTSGRKTSVPKYISYELMLPPKSNFCFQPVAIVTYSCALPENYAYLFYAEINPPPPKVSQA